MQTDPAMPRKRISIAVERFHVEHIRRSLADVDHVDFTVAPLMSGYGVRGYWSSEHAFNRIGERVMVRFTADEDAVRPLLSNGFGIRTSEVLQIGITGVAGA